MGEVIATAPARSSRKVLVLELLLLAVAGAVVLALTVVSPPEKPKPSFTPVVLGGQPMAAVVLAQEDKDLAVALAVQPGKQKLTLVATVLGQDGTGATGLDVSFRTELSDSTTLDSTGTPCTPGCYAATLDTSARPLDVAVTVTGPGSGRAPVRFPMPRLWPPHPASRFVAQTEKAYASLKSLVTTERLGTDPTHVQDTIYRAVAPDKLETDTRGGPKSVVIGKTRWDRQPGKAWVKTPQSSSIRSIAPYWAGILQDATLLGSAEVRGRPTWIVSFAAPQIPAFFSVWIDKTTHRTLQLKMTASAHFMRHTYGPFDAPITISPPR